MSNNQRDPKHLASGLHDRHMMLTSKFGVFVDKIHLAYFTKVSEVSLTTGTDPIKEGGVNGFVRELPNRTTIGRVTLEKGLVQNDLLWKWYQEEVMQGIFEPRTVRIHAHENIQSNKVPSFPLVCYILEQAFPISWKGPAFDTNNGEKRAVQSLTFICNGVKRQMGDQPYNLGDLSA